MNISEARKIWYAIPHLETILFFNNNHKINSEVNECLLKQVKWQRKK